MKHYWPVSPLEAIRVNVKKKLVDRHDFKMTSAYTAPCTSDTAPCVRGTKNKKSVGTFA